MNAQSNDGVKHANREIDRRTEGILDGIKEIRTRLDRLEREATQIEQLGLAAPQFATSVGGGSMNVDVRTYADLDAAVRTVNALRQVVALAER